jgi:hypothetical protein
LNGISPDAHIQVESLQFFDPKDSSNQKLSQLILEHKTIISSVAISVGLVTWAIQVGALFTSVIATVPAWKNLDPIAILGKDDDEDETEWGVPEDESDDQAEESASDIWSSNTDNNLNRDLR